MSNGPETTVTPGSSSIEEFTFDPDTDTLTVVFRDGSSYAYFNIPPAVHRALQRAGSHGSYLARMIKGRYAYEQV